jgi:drug/metabolite transporter (DMT)-like permease
LLPAWDVFFGFCSGIAVAMGFVFYYIASSRISPAISFSIAACDPFFTIILGVTFAGQLRGASLGKAALLLNAMLCYAIAIFLIASSIN